MYSLTGIAVFRWIVMSNKVSQRQQSTENWLKIIQTKEKTPKIWLNIIFYLSDENSRNDEKFEIFGTKTNFNLREVRLKLFVNVEHYMTTLDERESVDYIQHLEATLCSLLSISVVFY